MNVVDLFIHKLKSMQIQGYRMSDIIDEWETGNLDALYYLEQKLVWALLESDDEEINSLNKKIKYIKNMKEYIVNGLLE
jgi:hypothetical protein